MPGVDASKSATRPRGVTKDGVERRVGGAVKASERIAPEVRVLIDAGGDERMRDLEQDRRGAAERDEELAVESARDRIPRQDPDVRHTRSVRLIRSFGFAFEGISYLIRTQPNARIELAIGAVVLIVAAWLQVTPVEWAVLVLTIAFVLGLEALNTALELAVTLASPERQPLAKAAKDVAAAMVLIGAIAAVLVGLVLLGPRLIVLVS
jgi:diacylglycerol kinase